MMGKIVAPCRADADAVVVIDLDKLVAENKPVTEYFSKFQIRPHT